MARFLSIRERRRSAHLCQSEGWIFCSKCVQRQSLPAREPRRVLQAPRLRVDPPSLRGGDGLPRLGGRDPRHPDRVPQREGQQAHGHLPPRSCPRTRYHSCDSCFSVSSFSRGEFLDQLSFCQRVERMDFYRFGSRRACHISA